MTFVASAVVHAFRVFVRTFPSFPISRRSCIATSSVGACVTAMRSYSPIVKKMSIFAPSLFARAPTASARFGDSFTFLIPWSVQLTRLMYWGMRFLPEDPNIVCVYNAVGVRGTGPSPTRGSEFKPSRLAGPPDGRPGDPLDFGEGKHIGGGVLVGQRFGFDDVRDDESCVREGSVPVPVRPMEVDLGAAWLLEDDGASVEVALRKRELTLLCDRVDRRPP